MRRVLLVFVVLLLVTGSELPTEAYTQSTHKILTKMALQVLRSDARQGLGSIGGQYGHSGLDAEDMREAAAFWDKNETELQGAIQDMDRSPRKFEPPSFSLWHGYNPITKWGWGTPGGSVDYADHFYRQWRINLEQRKDDQFVRNIGVGVHLIQDITVPDHAVCPPKTHKWYEDFCHKLLDQVEVEKLHCRHISGLPGSYIEYGANISHKSFDDLYFKTTGNQEIDLRLKGEIAVNYMELAVELTAGFLCKAYDDMRFVKKQLAIDRGELKPKNGGLAGGATYN